MTFWRLDEWFWAMFDPTPTWPNYITERSVRWYYGFSIAAASAASAASATSPWTSLLLKFDTPMTRTTAFAAKRHSYPPNLQTAISFHSCEFGQIITRYNFLWHIWVVSEQSLNCLHLGLISPLANFACELGEIMTRYDFLWARRVILSIVQIDFNLNLI